MSDLSSKQISIAELIESGYLYEIPNYQRGYRWGKNEVTDLLEDISDVIKENVEDTELRVKCSAKPYCLQPISFDTFKEDEGIMVVVDGQQRLTTLFLILRYISERFNSISQEVLNELTLDDPSEFCKEIRLKYEDPTRDEIFDIVKQNLNTINVDNIDSHYITMAYSYIADWGSKNINRARMLIKFAIKLFYGTTIIWYEINQSTDGNSHDYFAKTNTGRIPLTNSELIKANLMMDEYCIVKEKLNISLVSDDIDKGRKEDELRKINRERLENQRIKISRQWDTIESDLRNNEFWYFLTEMSDQYEDTRIDFIFNIVAKELYQDLQLGYDDVNEFFNLNRERASFIIIARYLKQYVDKDINGEPIGIFVWKKTWNTYMVFKEWFENREWYHYIGYILAHKGSTYDAEKLLKIYEDRQYCTKSEIKTQMLTIIENTCGIRKSNNTVRSFDEYKDYVSKLKYGNNEKEIDSTLLLFNVISILNDKPKQNTASKTIYSSRDTFFPFSRYKTEKWNHEHIHSRADDKSYDRVFASEFIKYIEVMLERLKKEKISKNEISVLEKIQSEYYSKLEAHKNDGSSDDEAMRLAATESSQLWMEEFSDDLEEEKKDGIGNMALLDESTNKSYHNAPFFMKRMIISSIVMGSKPEISRFIPFCTRNVFDKTYTKLPSAMLHWNNTDYSDYLNTIVETIYRYFEGGVHS